NGFKPIQFFVNRGQAFTVFGKHRFDFIRPVSLMTQPVKRSLPEEFGKILSGFFLKIRIKRNKLTSHVHESRETNVPLPVEQYPDHSNSLTAKPVRIGGTRRTQSQSEIA